MSLQPACLDLQDTQIQKIVLSENVPHLLCLVINKLNKRCLPLDSS